MNKSEGNYNKEEKKGGTFTSLFSRNKKNDTYNQKESFFNSTDEKSSQTKDNPQSKPDTNNTPHSTATESQEQKSKDTNNATLDCPTIPRGRLPMSEAESKARSPWENPMERANIIEKPTVTEAVSEPTPNSTNNKHVHVDNKKKPNTNPKTLKGMMLGLLALVAVPYLLIIILFSIDFDSEEENRHNNIPTQNRSLYTPRQPEKPRISYCEIEVDDVIECVYELVIPNNAKPSAYRNIFFPKSTILQPASAPKISNAKRKKMEGGKYTLIDGKYVKESVMSYSCKFRVVNEGIIDWPVAHIVIGNDTLRVPAESHRIPDNREANVYANKIKVHPKGYFDNLRKTKEEAERRKQDAKLQQEIAQDKKTHGKFYNAKTQTLTLPETDYVGKPYAHAGIDAVKLVSAGVVTTIGDEVFGICHKLQTVVLKCKVIGLNSFKGCSSLRIVVITKNLNWIREGAFADCPHLERVLLSNTLSSVEDNIFANSNNIKEISIPHNIRNHFIKQFEHCKQLNTIYLLSPSFYKMPKTFKESPHDFSKCTLYVPDDKIEEFKADADWNKFASILPLSQSKWYDSKGWSKTNNGER